MNNHYQNYLYRKYEPLYREHTLPMSRTCMCWGFEVGDGWFHLINALSKNLCMDWLVANTSFRKIYGREGQLEFPHSKASKRNEIITPVMIEKARLAMVEAELTVPTAVQVKEKFGTLRFYVNNATAEHYALINLAETMSAHMCDVCGAPGKLRYDGWIRARCFKHVNWRR